MNVVNLTKAAAPVAPVDPNHVTTLVRAMSKWFVRRDNKFYDVDDLATKRSRVDIEQVALIRFAQEFPEIPLSQELVKQVWRRAIESRHTNVEESIVVWNGRLACLPGNPKRVIIERGAGTVNLWREPEYRRLGVTEADYGIAGEFFDWIFPRALERQMILDWLAWSLKNEEDKPNWAPFFYSKTMGTGKSVLCKLVTRLFGEANSITQNNLDKLTGKFNMTVLRSKLVVCEEVHLRPDSTQANTLKTYITEKTTAAEAKGFETERVEQRICMMLTSNHMPFWIEPEDRRYYIIEIDHDGYARGPRSEEFSALVGRLEEWAGDAKNIARLYNALMARNLAEEFSAKTLNVAKDGTEIMQRVFGGGRATVLDQLKEHLDNKGLNAIPEGDVVSIIVETLRGNINSTKYLMSDLGWTKREVKWGKVDYARQIWVRPGYVVQNGSIHGPDGVEVNLVKHLERFAVNIEL